jgi:hypothetical protein
MTEFINTNSHRAYLSRNADDREATVRIAPGQTFEATGDLAKSAEAAPGVVKANSDEGKAYEGREVNAAGTSVPVHTDEPSPSAERQEAVSEARGVVRSAANVANADRFTGEDGGVELAEPGDVAINAPSVGFPSTATGQSAEEQIVPAGPSTGQPAEGGPYDGVQGEAVGSPAEAQSESDASASEKSSKSSRSRSKATTSDKTPKK